MTRSPETRYASTEDGVSIAYQTIGEKPVDLVLELESWGNVEIMWELEALADLFERLSSFSRLILHDRRGTGLSGGRGSSFPNLETRARDLRTVLDTIRSVRAATKRWSPEYPWGSTPDEHRQDAAETRDGMGSERLARQWLMAGAPSFAGDERFEAEIARLDRHFMAPSTAADWINVESQTDVTAVLPLLRCPTLLLDYEQSSGGAAESRHVQSMIAGAELVLVSEVPTSCPSATAPRSAPLYAASYSGSGSEAQRGRTPSWAPFSSPTSLVRPSARQRLATGLGPTCFVAITPSFGKHSSDGTASRTTRRATASTQPSTDPPALSAAHSIS